jgi:flagellar biosynthesis/type III secretory pathway chaperone
VSDQCVFRLEKCAQWQMSIDRTEAASIGWRWQKLRHIYGLQQQQQHNVLRLQEEQTSVSQAVCLGRDLGSGRGQITV